MAQAKLTPAALAEKSTQYRRDLMTFIYESGAGHTGGSLSCVDILNVLYNSVMDISPGNWDSIDRDFYVHSKGHSVEALYVVLADQGFFPRSALTGAGQVGSPFIGHPTRKVPGVEQNTGGLGHGLSFSVGLALSAKLDERGSRTFCLLGDGEMAEGSNWEAAMSAAHYSLDNLVAIVDRNRLQITGDTEDVVRLEPLAEKWAAFGWSTRVVDGHELPSLVETLGATPFEAGRPSLVIASTVKGHGVSFIENNARWHHKVPTEDQYRQAMQELGGWQ